MMGSAQREDKNTKPGRGNTFQRKIVSPLPGLQNIYLI